MGKHKQSRTAEEKRYHERRAAERAAAVQAISARGGIHADGYTTLTAKGDAPVWKLTLDRTSTTGRDHPVAHLEGDLSDLLVLIADLQGVAEKIQRRVARPARALARLDAKNRADALLRDDLSEVLGRLLGPDRFALLVDVVVERKSFLEDEVEAALSDYLAPEGSPHDPDDHGGTPHDDDPPEGETP